MRVTNAIRDGARLAALRNLDLLDTGPDDTIERFTGLASELLRAPVSLVSLLDEERQYFIAQSGLVGEWAQARQTPLSHSFCKYTVATKETLVISDAREHPLVSENLAVRDLGVVAYAGIPLVLDDGNAVGALCAIDTKPRRWTQREIRILSDLAAAVKAVLDLRAALARQGLHDRLTGLPNRDLLVAYCAQLIEQHSDAEMVAVMCAGIDHFTQINQAFGTDSADCVLATVAERLEASVRDSDLLGRLRGDIFTVVCSGVHDEKEAIGLAGRLRGALASPVRVGGEQLSVGITVGISTGQVGANAADLISEAANAMREAKQHPGRIRLAEERWSEQAATQLRLREALHGAVAREEVEAVFQPIVELDSEELIGFEALARWHHPELGQVSPDVFIPMAELTADIIPLGEWMLERACQQLSVWRRDPHCDLQVTVNVSPLQLEQPNFSETVAGTLDRHGLPGDAVGIEITEGVLLKGGAIQEHNLLQLRQLGVRIILDDFGTGYSALSYLRRFPIDVIKIDRCFVDDMVADRDAATVVQAILAMASAMKTKVIAEGIETTGQAELIGSMGCRFGQGYLFGKPVSAGDTSV